MTVDRTNNWILISTKLETIGLNNIILAFEEIFETLECGMQLKSAVQFSITFHQLQTGESTNLKKLINK